MKGRFERENRPLCNGDYYFQFYDGNTSPSQKKVSLGTKRKRVAQKLKRTYEDGYALEEYDPWTGKKLSMDRGRDSRPRRGKPFEFNGAVGLEFNVEGKAPKEIGAKERDGGRFSHDHFIRLLSQDHVSVVQRGIAGPAVRKNHILNPSLRKSQLFNPVRRKGESPSKSCIDDGIERTASVRTDSFQ